MQELQEMLRRGLDLSPVRLLCQTLSCLLFADDIVLLATTPDGLQRQVNILQQFCQSRYMEVNLDKTAVVIFNRPRSQPLVSGIYYQGQHIALTD